MAITNEHLREMMKRMQARHAGTDAIAVTAVAIGIWEQLALKFIPMIGLGSVRLIYTRSLELNKSAFPWLPAALAGVEQSPFATLKMSLERREPAEVIAANCALLNSFIDVLATLIGVRLTLQFLRAAFPHEAIHENSRINPQ